MAIRLSLNQRDPSKGVCLEFRADVDDDWVEPSLEFVQLVRQLMPRETQWFHQTGVRPDGKPSSYHSIEFWNYARHSEVIKAQSTAIAAALGYPLEIQV